MKIYDSHLHLNPKLSLEHSFSKLKQDCESSNVTGGLIISLENDPWEFSKIAEITKLNSNFKLAYNPCLAVSKKNLRKSVISAEFMGCAAIKIHPRLQQTNLLNKKVWYLVEIAEEEGLPVVICSFDDGTWSRLGLKSEQFLKLADKFPNVKFLWAHAGGHRVLDFMFMARRTQNVYLDTSFTQTYFFKGNVMNDLNYATESLPNRFLFGTDLEEDSYQSTVSNMSDFYLQQNDNRDLFFYKNYVDLFSL